MDAKLKALKVPELKAILAKSQTQIPSKANKQDLINKIIATPAALDAYNAQFNSVKKPQQSPPAQVPPDPEPTATPEAEPVKVDAPSQSSEDVEQEKRRQRAARFGIPLVEQQPSKKKNGADAQEKLEARAERFGITPASSAKRKRGGAPVEEVVDSEEQERRRKRAERFGTTT